MESPHSVPHAEFHSTVVAADTVLVNNSLRCVFAAYKEVLQLKSRGKTFNCVLLLHVNIFCV